MTGRVKQQNSAWAPAGTRSNAASRQSTLLMRLLALGLYASLRQLWKRIQHRRLSRRRRLHRRLRP